MRVNSTVIRVSENYFDTEYLLDWNRDPHAPGPETSLGIVGNSRNFPTDSPNREPILTFANIFIKAPKGAPKDYEIKIRRRVFYLPFTGEGAPFFGETEELIVNLTQEPWKLPPMMIDPSWKASYGVNPVDSWWHFRSKSLSGSDEWLRFPANTEQLRDL